MGRIAIADDERAVISAAVGADRRLFLAMWSSSR
jgi:hypothetical protein